MVNVVMIYLRQEIREKQVRYTHECIHNEYSDPTKLILTSNNVQITQRLKFRSVKIASKFTRFSVYREDSLSYFAFIVKIV
jgi:hypothetical protein